MIDIRNTNRHRWGIIYVPQAGAFRPMKRWKEIREYLSTKGVEYDYIESENYKSVERQVRMFADNGYGTVVLVGGDGALQDAVNGIMSSRNKATVSLGIIPNGIANDFAGYWGLSVNDYRMAIDNIIAHRVRKVDVGCCSYLEDGVEAKRYFLNVLNIGLSAHIVEFANKERGFLAKYVYRLRAFLHLLFHRQNFLMKFKLNSQVVEKKFMMLCIGNSFGYGMTPSAVPYNGWLDVSAVKMPKWLGVLEGLHMMVLRKMLNFRLVEPFRSTEIYIESVGGARLGIDGRPFKPTFPMTVTVLPEEINLIIPTKINKRL